MQNLLDVRHQCLAHTHTIQNLQRDFSVWHLDRPSFAFWALDVDCDAVRSQLLMAKQQLADFLIPCYSRQPHVTLGICGFLSAQPKYADDYGVDAFESDVRALRMAQFQPFEIEISQLNSFSSAPFYYVNDSAHSLTELHNCLHRLKDHAHEKYVPHVTVGLYAQQIPTANVIERIDAFAEPKATRLLINKISLMRYTASEIGGELMTIVDFNLEKAQLKWRENSPFA